MNWRTRLNKYTEYVIALMLRGAIIFFKNTFTISSENVLRGAVKRSYTEYSSSGQVFMSTSTPSRNIASNRDFSQLYMSRLDLHPVYISFKWPLHSSQISDVIALFFYFVMANYEI